MQRMHSSSQVRTPTYPTREETSIGKIVKDKLKIIQTGKISLGSDKGTAVEMDELLIASSPSNSSQESNP